MNDLPAKPKRKRFDRADHDIALEALRQNELWPYSLRDQEYRLYWEKFRHKLEAAYGNASKRRLSLIPASSGTAAIHIALGGLQIPAGTEVIVPPLTDMGTIMPVIFQNCIPVFADLESQTGLLSADTIEARITERTRAVIVVHLSGSPADMDPIMELCRAKNIKVIEDAAQALGSDYKGRPAGTIGDAGAFSLNSWKHITAGEGGFVLVPGTETDDAFLRCLSFSDKHRDRVDGQRTGKSEHRRYAGSGLNYRMSDLELGLASVQFDKLSNVAAKFTELGRHLDARLTKIPGIRPQAHHREATPVYFFNFFRLETGDVKRRDAIIASLKDVANSMGMSLAPSYGTKALYEYDVFQKRDFFDTESADSRLRWPGELLARHLFPSAPDNAFSYTETATRCPNTQEWIDLGFGLYFNEAHEIAHIDAFADALAAEMNTQKPSD